MKKLLIFGILVLGAFAVTGCSGEASEATDPNAASKPDPNADTKGTRMPKDNQPATL
jgi:PBP1b-binding outer membrane lipoprotein LpoB